MYKMTLAAVLAAGLLLGCKPQAPPPAPGPSPAPKVVKTDPGDGILSTSPPPRTGGTDILGPTATPPPTPPPVAPPVAGASRKYVVKAGDTMIKIARQEFGDEHRLKDIKALNPGIDADKLKVGQEILIPAK